MTVKHLGEGYDFPPANRADAYGGDINFYIQWERHLLYACPSAYRVPPDLKLREFLETMLRPDYHAHPDTARLDFAQCVWQLDQRPWQPDLERTLAENGIGHMSFVQFRAPGLDGMHGVGN